MTLELQFKIKENEHYLRCLRQNWYKILNRSPWEFKRFEEEVRKTYHLSKMDRLEKAFNTFEMLEKILGTFK